MQRAPPRLPGTTWPRLSGLHRPNAEAEFSFPSSSCSCGSGAASMLDAQRSSVTNLHPP